LNPPSSHFIYFKACILPRAPRTVALFGSRSAFTSLASTLAAIACRGPPTLASFTDRARSDPQYGATDCSRPNRGESRGVARITLVLKMRASEAHARRFVCLRATPRGIEVELFTGSTANGDIAVWLSEHYNYIVRTLTDSTSRLVIR
jgi:hypothetical protein